jgi:hypothetical protein
LKQGNTFTVEEFIHTLTILRAYSEPHSQFDEFAATNLEFASTLDQNTVIITLEELKGVLNPVVSAGLIVST